MTLPRTAAAYAVLAEHEIEVSAQPGNPDPHWHLMRAQSFASLSDAAATLEAARLMGPTPEDHARLDALRLSVEDQYAPYYCSREWVDEEAVIPSQVDGTDLRAHDGKPHRCVYKVDHEKDDPHYCRCGSEL